VRNLGEKEEGKTTKRRLIRKREKRLINNEGGGNLSDPGKNRRLTLGRWTKFLPGRGRQGREKELKKGQRESCGHYPAHLMERRGIRRKWNSVGTSMGGSWNLLARFSKKGGGERRGMANKEEDKRDSLI